MLPLNLLYGGFHGNSLQDAVGGQTPLLNGCVRESVPASSLGPNHLKDVVHCES